jgi:hypothetical protein
LEAVKVVVPAPLWVKLPVPLIVLARLTASLLFTASEPLLVIAPLPSEPVVPPLPIRSVPALITVPPV